MLEAVSTLEVVSRFVPAATEGAYMQYCVAYCVHKLNMDSEEMFRAAAKNELLSGVRRAAHDMLDGLLTDVGGRRCMRFVECPCPARSGF